MNRSLNEEEEPKGLRFSLSEPSFLRSHRARTPLRMAVLASEKPLLRISSKSTTLEVMIDLSGRREERVSINRKHKFSENNVDDAPVKRD